VDLTKRSGRGVVLITVELIMDPNFDF